MAQVTHRRDPDTGRMIQIVSAAELTRVLIADGDSLARPRDYGPDDEWFVAADYADYAAAYGAASRRSVHDKLIQIAFDSYKAHPHR